MKERVEGDELFFARAAQAGDEFRKHTLAFSVGGLGAFFVSLTGEASSKLSSSERTILAAAVVVFALATLCGLFAWFFAGRYFYNRARYGEEKTRAKVLHVAKNAFDLALVVFFAAAVVLSAVFLSFKLCVLPAF